MRKKLLLLPVFLLAVTLSSCGEKEDSSPTSNVDPVTSTPITSTSDDPITDPTDIPTTNIPTTTPTTTVPKEVLTNVYLAGDSTVKTYDDDQFIGGWGQYIDLFFDEEVNVINCAEGGRSSRSFINEGRLYDIDSEGFSYTFTQNNKKSIESTIKKGDYLFIQFAHNDDDSKKESSYSTLYDRMVPLGEADSNGIYPTIAPTAKSPTTYLPDEYLNNMSSEDITKAYQTIAKYGSDYYSYDCGGTYKWYLKQYIDFARSKDATPVLVTPVVRVSFNGSTIKSGAGYHGIDFSYVKAVRQLAEEENCLLIDLFNSTKELAETTTSTYSDYLMALKPNSLTGVWPSGYDKAYKNADLGYTGIEATHYNKYGAYLTAAYAAKQIKDMGNNIGISQYVLTTPEDFVNPSNLLPKSVVNTLESLIPGFNVTDPNRTYKDPNEIVTLIDELPEVEQIDDDNYLTYDPLVNEVIDKYYELNIDDRSLVSNSDKLFELREEIDCYINDHRPVPTTTIIYNANSFDAQVYSTATTIDGFTVGSGAEVKTGASSFKYNGETISQSKYIIFGGKGSSTDKYIEFTTSSSATITIAAGSSGSTDRTLALTNKTDSTKSYTFNAPKALSTTTVDNIPAGTYYLASTGSGIYVYSIIIEYFD